MKEQLIEFDTAQLAKEKGFDIPVENYYLSNEGEKQLPNYIDFKNYNRGHTQEAIEGYISNIRYYSILHQLNLYYKNGYEKLIK